MSKTNLVEKDEKREAVEGLMYCKRYQNGELLLPGAIVCPLLNGK
jgi:hypothetical protein